MSKLSNTFDSQFCIDEQVFDSLDRRALVKVLSLYGILDKSIKVISAMYENNTAAKVWIEASSWFHIKSGAKQGSVLSPCIWIIVMDFNLKSTGKAIGEHGINGDEKISWT